MNSYYRLSAVLLIILSGLHILGMFDPGAQTWGFHFLAFLPVPIKILYVFLAIFILVYFYTRPVPGSFRRVQNFMAGKPYHFLAIVISLFVCLAVAFRVDVPLFGDGFFLVKNFSDALKERAPLYLRNEPLATSYFFVAAKMTGVTTFNEFMDAFLIAEIFLGACFIISVYFITRNLFGSPQDRVVSFVFILVVPYIQLFFGYIETYGVTLFALSLYTLAAILYLRGKTSVPAVVLSYFLLFLSHYLTIALFPSLVFIAYLEIKTRGWRTLLKSFGAVIIIIFVILGFSGFDIDKFYAWVPHSHFLPITGSSDIFGASSEAYTLFSLNHAMDIFNYFTLLSATSIILLTLLFRRKIWGLIRSKENIFLILSVIPVYFLFLVLKFDLGMAKDWDVFAAYSFLPALFGISVILKIRPPEHDRITAAVIALTFLNTSGFILLNSTIEPNISRYESLLDATTMSPDAYYGATLHLARYYHQVRNKTAALDLWEKYSEVFPRDSRGHRNIITNLRILDGKDLRRMQRAYERWLSLMPGDSAVKAEYSRLFDGP